MLSRAVANNSGMYPRLFRLIAACFAIAVGILTLGGWFFDVPRLADWTNDGIAMFPNTAICTISVRRSIVGTHLAAANASLGRSMRRISDGDHCRPDALRACVQLEHRHRYDARFAALGNSGCNRAYANGSAGFDFVHDLGHRRSSGECSAQSSVNVASGLAIFPLVIAALSLTGYWFGADELFGIAKWTGIARQTSIVLAALGIGFIAAIPEYGIAVALGRRDASGALLRRLIAPVILVPLLLGWLRILGQNAGMYDLAFGTALRTVLEIVLLLGLVWWTAQSVGHLLRVAEQAKAKVAAIIESSDDAIISKSLNGMIESWNGGPSGCLDTPRRRLSASISLSSSHQTGSTKKRKSCAACGRGNASSISKPCAVRKDGRHLNISLTVSPIRDASAPSSALRKSLATSPCKNMPTRSSAKANPNSESSPTSFRN